MCRLNYLIEIYGSLGESMECAEMTRTIDGIGRRSDEDLWKNGKEKFSSEGLESHTPRRAILLPIIGTPGRTRKRRK